MGRTDEARKIRSAESPPEAPDDRSVVAHRKPPTVARELEIQRVVTLRRRLLRKRQGQDGKGKYCDAPLSGADLSAAKTIVRISLQVNDSGSSPTDSWGDPSPANTRRVLRGDALWFARRTGPESRAPISTASVFFRFIPSRGDRVSMGLHPLTHCSAPHLPAVDTLGSHHRRALNRRIRSLTSAITCEAVSSGNETSS